MLHFSTNLVHEPSNCSVKVESEMKEEHKPIFCFNFTNFPSKYTFDIPTLKTPNHVDDFSKQANFRDIKLHPKEWVVTSPRS